MAAVLALLVGVTKGAEMQTDERHPIWAAQGELAELKAKVADYMAMDQAQLRATISAKGPAARNYAPNPQAEAAYALGQLYLLTADADYARRAAVLLERFAEVFAGWPKKAGHSSGAGIWTRWYHLDLWAAKGVALAYDAIHNSGQMDIEKVRSFLLDVIRTDLTTYRMYTFNMCYWKPSSIVIFGRVLRDPELVHLGYWYYNKLVQEYYCHDGFLSEGTYSYHVQMTGPLLGAENAVYMDGYSDPPGYRHTPFDVRFDPERIDDYSLAGLFALDQERMQAIYKTALPNGEWPVLNDTEHYGQRRAVPCAASQLLSGLGHAILAQGNPPEQVQVRLDFSPRQNHGHNDALSLIYYDRGTEVVGGTAYRYGNQQWNVSTFNQNLVVVNGKEQKSGYWADWTLSPYVPGEPRREVTRLEFTEQVNAHNNVLLWEPPGYGGFTGVQVVEAEATDAYAGLASRYQRLLALVDAGNGSHYTVDLFRVKGGTRYDWCLKGGHKQYRLSTSLAMVEASSSLGRISLAEAAVTDATWKGSFTYDSVIHDVTMLARPGTTVYRGSGPRSIKPGGVHEYLVVRRQAEKTVEEHFLAVHETHTGTAAVERVEALRLRGPADAVGLRVDLRGGVTDYLIHTLANGPTYAAVEAEGVGRFVVTGRFAHVRLVKGEVRWLYLLDGSHLRFGSRVLSAATGDFSLRGTVVGVNRRKKGATRDGFVIAERLPQGSILSGKTMLLTWGNGWNWAYTIVSVNGSEVAVRGEPGFEYRDGRIFMEYWPVPEYTGTSHFERPVTFTIAGSALMHGSGTIVATDRASR